MNKHNPDTCTQTEKHTGETMNMDTDTYWSMEKNIDTYIQMKTHIIKKMEEATKTDTDTDIKMDIQTDMQKDTENDADGYTVTNTTR